jgi:hypothetical protein
MGSPRRVAQLTLLATAIVVLFAAVASRRSVEVWHVAPETPGDQDEGP